MYVHVYVYVCVYVCIYIYIRARVGVHMRSCRRILFICTVQSLYYMQVYHRCFLTLACVCVGGLEVGFVSACSWLALVTGVGGYVLAGIEIGVLSSISLYFVWDGHLDGQKNPDRLKRSIHVDRIGVHSTFVYIYAVLRVLMIWANCFFLVTCLFFLER